MRKQFFSVLLCWLGLIVQAQDSLRSGQLNEIVVTATKFPKSIGETGKVLTVIDESQIQKSLGKDISQLLNEQAGVVVNGANSNPGKDKAVYLQGAGSAYTLILLDGVPLSDPSGINGGAFDLRLLPLEQVERIEIVKGSQSTLYGSDAIAGVINIITKKGGVKPINVFGSMAYGSYNSFRGSGGMSGSTRKLDYNLAYNHFTSAGFSEAKDTTKSQHFKKNGVTQNSVQANFSWRPVSKLTINPFFRYNNFFSTFDNGPFSDAPNNSGRLSLLNAGTQAQLQLPKGKLNFWYGYENSQRLYNYNSVKYNYHGKFENADAFLLHNFSRKAQLLGGVTFQQWKMFDTTTLKKNPDISLVSPYLSFYVRNMSGFSLEVGGRQNLHSRYGNNFTWSFNPSYVMAQRAKLFFNYSTGFKAPSLNQLYSQYGANPNLKPETSQSIEVGTELFSATNKFNVRAVAFVRNINQAIFYQVQPNYTYNYVNLARQRDHGWELESTLQVNPKVTLKGFYAFVAGQFTTKTSAGSDTTYNNLLRRPKNSFGVSINCLLTEKLSASVQLKTFGDRLDQYYDSNFNLKTITLQAYQLLDIYLEYQLIKKTKIFLDLRNVLNQNYMEVYGYSTLPFNIQAGINARW